ncbi:MAG: M1 family metallopeptidase [Clostridiales bacterium]|nr:M1 family metallopeptidase [Clostridiales bacterium]
MQKVRKVFKRVTLGILALCCAVLGVFTLAGCEKESKSYTRYEITAEYSPENRTLAGTAKVTFENGGNGGVSLLKFRLFPNAYRQDALYRPISTALHATAYYEGESYGEMVISSVHGAKSWEVMGEDENILYVYLPEALYQGDRVVLDIGFLTKLASVNHRTGVTKKTVNLGNFYPVLCGEKNGGFYETAYYAEGSPFYTDAADYFLRLTVPKDYVVVATGGSAVERLLESKKVCVSSCVGAREFAVSLSRSYRVLEGTVNGKKLAYYYHADTAPQATLETLKQAFACYETLFGLYPYPQYAMAETGLCLDYAAYSGLLFLSDGLTGEARTAAIAEGVAKQWWGETVGSDNVENGWQSDGLAGYSLACFYESHPDYGVRRDDVVARSLKEYRSYYDVYGSVLGRTDTRMSKHLSEFIGGYEYRCLAYDKAVVMFDVLRKSVGDKKFFAALRRYYGANCFAMADVGALIGAFEKAGVDAHGFFDGFLSGKVIL